MKNFPRNVGDEVARAQAAVARAERLAKKAAAKRAAS